MISPFFLFFLFFFNIHLIHLFRSIFAKKKSFLFSNSQVPILVNKPKEKKKIDPEKKKQAILLKKRREKKLLLAKDHVVPQFNDLEKRLLKTATKGTFCLCVIVCVFLFESVQRLAKEKTRRLIKNNIKKSREIPKYTSRFKKRDY